MNWPKPRIEVEGMQAYSAPLEGRRKLIRLDFNENTIGPSPKVIEALKQITSNNISIYPEYNGLKEALIKNLTLKKGCRKLSPQEIAIFNGVDSAINAIFHAYGDKEDIFLTTKPTFGYYAPCAQMRGMITIDIPYEGNEFNFPTESILKELNEKEPRLLMICNPNNPTGTRLAADKIIEMSYKSPKTLIVIDELYEGFTGDSVLPKIDFNCNSNVIVLRSLSKTAGLAGLRIGFAIGNRNVINSITRVIGPYDVNTFAVTAALAALKDQSYIDAYISEVKLAREWIKNKLTENKVRFHLSGGNYFLIWPNKKPSEVEKFLRNEGILIRDMSNKELIENSLRVTIGTRKQMKIFWDSFAKYEDFS